MIASMNNIPSALTETAELDGVSRLRRLVWVYVPIMTPTLFFLVIINTIYAFFHTFAFIDLMTDGGPSSATNILIFDLYQEGFSFFNFGLASAKSVVLFVVVGLLMYVQFRVTDEYSHYGG
jgi:sn-glycerol 3-phosphate transport system permease protein